MHFPMAGAGAAPASSRARFCFSAEPAKGVTPPIRGGGCAHVAQIWSRIEPGAVATPAPNRYADPQHTFAPSLWDLGRINPQRLESAGAAQRCH